jgi:hypothetical protein
LSEFRTRLVQGKLELVLLDVLLDRVHELGLLMAVRVRLRESPTVTSSRSMLSMQNLTSSRERPRKNWNGR